MFIHPTNKSNNLLVIVHDGTHQLVNGSHDELAEGPLQRLGAALWLLHVGPHLAAVESAGWISPWENCPFFLGKWYGMVWLPFQCHVKTTHDFLGMVFPYHTYHTIPYHLKKKCRRTTRKPMQIAKSIASSASLATSPLWAIYATHWYSTFFYYDPPMATSTLPQSRSTPSQGINVLYKVQRSLLSAIVYTAQVKNSRHPFLPGVPLPALAFVEQGHPPVINLNSSQSETFKDPKGANGFCLIGHQYMPLSLSWSGKA